MRYDLGGVRFEPGFVGASGITWIGLRLDGWDSPELRQELVELQSQHGQQFGESRYSGRPMVLKGAADLPDEDHFWVARNQLAAATNYAGAGTPLQVFEPAAAGGTKRCQIRRGGRVRMDNHEDVLFMEFEVPLIAPDPRKYADAESVVSGSGTFTVTNPGNFQSPPVLEFTGAATINNDTVGRGITVNNGGANVVDVARRTVRSGGNNVYGTLASPPAWWELVPGANQITYTGGGSLTVRFRGAWI